MTGVGDFRTCSTIADGLKENGKKNNCSWMESGKEDFASEIHLAENLPSLIRRVLSCGRNSSSLRYKS